MKVIDSHFKLQLDLDTLRYYSTPVRGTGTMKFLSFLSNCGFEH